MENTILEPSLYSIKAILILDNDGRRLVAKYFDGTFPSVKEQKAFESNLFQKTQKANAEILMLDGLTCVYRSNVDLYFYVIGSSQENELMLSMTLNTLYEAVAQLLRKNVEKSVLLDNVDQVFLLVDELCDNGVLLESDAQTLAQRVAIRHDDIPLNEQTVAQVIQTAKEQLKWSLLK